MSAGRKLGTNNGILSTVCDQPTPLLTMGFMIAPYLQSIRCGYEVEWFPSGSWVQVARAPSTDNIYRPITAVTADEANIRITER